MIDSPFCYSNNEEDYQGSYASREDALRDGSEYLEPGATSVWTARAVRLETRLPALCKGMAEDLIERLNETLYDDCGGDDPIIEIEPEQLARLDEIIASFFSEHATFTRWGVGDVVKHEVAP